MALFERVQRTIEEVLRPLIEADGGRISIQEVSDRGVVVQLSAGCAGCPGFDYTRRAVVEPVIRSVVGEGVPIIVKALAMGAPEQRDSSKNAESGLAGGPIQPPE